jgi:rifampicin phosphotransferase
VSARVLQLADIGENAASLVGGKALHLAQLRQAGFPVPDGFCLTTTATRDWDDDARAALIQAYYAMGGGKVAVRSSACGEDGDEASYAGVFCSVLGVDGEAALVEAVERCLASLHEPCARRYRDTLPEAALPAMAVLVMRMVDARCAGIAYTCAPLEPTRRHIHINTVWGLAEPLAAGRVEGDGYIVSRSGKLLHRNLTEKPTQLTAAGEQRVPAGLRRTSSLTDAQARRVVRMAIKAEKFFGKPQDVEFAFDQNQLWLLQSRPIAVNAEDAAEVEDYLKRERRHLGRTSAALRRKGLVTGSDIVYSNGNIGELLPTPTTMSFGLFRRVFAGRYGSIVSGRQRLGYRFPTPDAAEHLFERIAGQPYFNLEIDAGTFDYGASPPVQHYLDQVARNPALANYPEVNLYTQFYATAEEANALGDAAGDAVLRAQAFRDGLAGHARDFLPRFPLEIEPRLAAMARPDWLSCDREASVAALESLTRELRTFACVEFVVAARLGFYFAALVRKRLAQLLGETGESLYAPLLSGLQGSLVTQQTLDLEQVAQGAMSRSGFLARYGHTARNELELLEPRLAEVPAMLEAMLHDLGHSGRSPREDFERKQAERIAAEERLIAALEACGTDAEARRVLFEDLQFAQRFLPLRETIKHYYTMRYAEIRRGLLHLEALLGWEHELVFHLYPEELARTLRDTACFERRARARRKEWHTAAKVVRQQSLPDVIFASKLHAITGRGPIPEASDTRLLGMPLSPGRIQGVARVVDPAELDSREFGADDILVLRSANLGIAPLLRVVGGMVVEVGGLLAHGACQAREAGVPAVVLPQATHLITDGMPLWLDGALGTIEFVIGENTAQPARRERAVETV